MTWVEALKTIGPIVLSTIPGAAPFVPLVLKGIEVAEDSKAPGHTKKQLAKDITGLAANVVNTVKKSVVIDPVEATSVADRTIDLVVEATNQFHKETNSATNVK